MDFSNEHYVRIYTRDTTTWKLLGFEGQTVLMHLWRKLDAAGVLEIEGVEPWEAVLLHTSVPEPIARVGMDACLKRGVFVHRGPYLVAPKYQEGQEASKSDRQRQKESRTSRAEKALRSGLVTNRDDESQTVTKTSQPVTGGHIASQAVTSCHPHTSSSSIPITSSTAGALPACARARGEWTDRDQAELDAIDPPDPQTPKPEALHALIWDAWLSTAHGGKDAGHYPRADVFACCEVLLARGLGVDAFRAAAETWFERKKRKGGEFRFSWFAQDLAGLLDHSMRPRGAPVPVSTAAAFAADGEDDFERLRAMTAANNGAANG